MLAEHNYMIGMLFLAAVKVRGQRGARACRYAACRRLVDLQHSVLTLCS